MFWLALVAEPNHAEDIAYDKVKHWQVPHAVVMMHYKQPVVTSCIPFWLQHQNSRNTHREDPKPP